MLMNDIFLIWNVADSDSWYGLLLDELEQVVMHSELLVVY